MSVHVKIVVTDDDGGLIKDEEFDYEPRGRSTPGGETLTTVALCGFKGITGLWVSLDDYEALARAAIEIRDELRDLKQTGSSGAIADTTAWGPVTGGTSSDLVKVAAQARVAPRPYCCPMMRAHLTSTCPEHPNRLDCGDTVLHDYHGAIGMPVHDGGRSRVTIRFCPFCGIRISVS